MRKLLCVILSVVFLIGLTACGDKKEVNEEVMNFVEESGDAFLEGFEEGLSAAGLNAETNMKADGNNIIISCNLEGIDGVPEDAKKDFQETLSSVEDDFRRDVQVIKDEVESLEKIIINICEEDGDFIAKAEVDFGKTEVGA